MTWQSVRLELDRTGEFPRGSASRAYLLRLPLLDDGTIDDEAIARMPERSGHVRRIGDGWACVSGANDGELAV